MTPEYIVIYTLNSQLSFKQWENIFTYITISSALHFFVYMQIFLLNHFPSACRTSLNISWSAGPLETKSCSLFVLAALHSASFLSNAFTRYRILRGQFHFFPRTLTMFLHYRLTCFISVKKSVVILWFFFSVCNVFFPLVAFKILSLLNKSNLIIPCLGVLFFLFSCAWDFFTFLAPWDYSFHQIS